MEAALRQSALCEWLTINSEATSEEAFTDPDIMMTHLELGSNPAKRQRTHYGRRESLLAEGLAKSHSELSIFFAAISENATLEGLCKPPEQIYSLSGALLEKVNTCPCIQRYFASRSCRSPSFPAARRSYIALLSAMLISAA